MRIKTKRDRRHRISLRLRKRVGGTSERPRLAVFRSVSHIYAQVIDDQAGTTLVSASTAEPALKATLTEGAKGGNLAGAKAIGAAVAERLKAKGITRVVFDRGGFLYHGRVKAVADAAREAGLEF
ncbi:MAG: 50S ribosomal protein L18 [Vicinamibacteraceae bacterium]